MNSHRYFSVSLIVLMAAAACLYLSRWPFYYPGMMNDDAVYIMGAKALLQGHYRALHYPGAPPYTLYPPGFSLLLVPFVAMSHSHLDILRIVPLLLAFLNAFLFWHLLKPRFSYKWRLFVLALFVFNPLTVSVSTPILSEPLFMTCILLTFLCFHRILNQYSPAWAPWVLGIVVGCSMLVRTVGAVLILAILLGLVTCKRWIPWIVVAVTSSMVGLSFSIRNHFLSHEWSGYVSAWKLEYADIFDLRVMLQSMNQAFNTLLISGLWATDTHFYALPIGLTPLIRIGTAILLLAGAFHLWRTQPQERPLTLSMCAFIGLWGIVHILWNGDSGRYFWPAFPFLLIMFILGIQRLCRDRRWAKVFCVCLIVTAYAHGNIQLWIQSKRSGPFVFPSQTYRWMVENLSPEALVLNPNAGGVFLHTSRHALGLLRARDRDRFRYLLLSKNVNFILAQPFPMLDGSIQADMYWHLDQRWAASWPEAFRRDYQNAEEMTELYQVVPNQEFQEAYRLFDAACRSISSGRLPEGLSQLRRALTLYPHFSTALNAYASAILQTSDERKVSKAIAILRESVKVDPSNALAFLDLARVYRLSNRNSEALSAFREAYRLTLPPSAYADLRPTIEVEGQSLTTAHHDSVQ